MFRKGARWCGARAGLNREDAIEPPGGAQRTSDDRCRASIGNGGCVGREWAAPPPGTPNHAGKGEKKLRRAPLAVNDGRQCREVLQGVGEGRPLRDGERREPEAAASHEAGFASPACASTRTALHDTMITSPPRRSRLLSGYSGSLTRIIFAGSPKKRYEQEAQPSAKGDGNADERQTFHRHAL